MSREHVVSQNLFDGDLVTVHGFPWCRDNPITIGLPNLTARILCETHNHALSDVDTAGGEAFRAIREMSRLSTVRMRLKAGRWRVMHYHIDGPLLERSFLKTLINLALERENRIGQDSNAAGRPSDRLVRIAFGFTQFGPGAGLSTVVHVGQQIQSADVVQFAPLIQNASYISAGLFAFRGFRFLLALDTPGFTRLPGGVGLPREDWGASQLNYHNREMRETLGKYLSQVIHIDW